MPNLKRNLTNTKNTGAVKGKSISISQFNVLANNLCESGGFNTNPEFLKWDYRRNLLGMILLENTFDIMCFEEVDELPLNEIKSVLVPLGYDYAWKQKFYSKPNEPNDGTAVFWNKKLFKLGKEKILQYSYNSQPTTQFAMMLCLQSISTDSFSVCVVATHLKAKPGFEDIRKIQSEQLISELKNFNSNNYAEIICGDFNDTPDSPACHIMKQNYKSAYDSELVNPINDMWTTCKKRKELVKRTIDYIFYDNTKINCIKILDIPQDPNIILPNGDYPSDHLLIGAVFSI